MMKLKNDLSDNNESLPTLHNFSGWEPDHISGKKAYADVQTPPSACLGFLPNIFLPLRLSFRKEMPTPVGLDWAGSVSLRIPFSRAGMQGIVHNVRIVHNSSLAHSHTRVGLCYNPKQ